MQADRTFESSPLTFQVLRELSDETLAPEWNSLLELSHCNRAFSSPEWFIATCRHKPSLQPNVIIARRGKALAGRGKGSRFRKRLKRLHCLAEKSNLSLRELEPNSFPPHKLPEVFLSLHLERQLVKSCFESRSAQAFVREAVPSLFQQASIRACALFEMDRILAIDLYTMGSNSLCAWNGGFLSEAEPYSPGKLLINAGIKLALALSLEECDFMRGPEAYETSWANQSRSIGRLRLSVAREH